MRRAPASVGTHHGSHRTDCFTITKRSPYNGNEERKHIRDWDRPEMGTLVGRVLLKGLQKSRLALDWTLKVVTFPLFLGYLSQVVPWLGSEL